MDLSSKGATPKNQFHEWHEISLIRLCCNAFSANRLNKFIRELTLDYGCLASLFQAIGGCIAKRIYSSYFLKTKTEVGLESLFLNCTSFGGAYNNNRKSKFTPAQIAKILKDFDLGKDVEGIL